MGEETSKACVVREGRDRGGFSCALGFTAVCLVFAPGGFGFATGGFGFSKSGVAKGGVVAKSSITEVKIC